MKKMTLLITVVFALIINSFGFAGEAPKPPQLNYKGELLSSVGKVSIETDSSGKVQKITIDSEEIPYTTFYVHSASRGQIMAIVNGREITCPNLAEKTENEKKRFEGNLYAIPNPPGTFAVAQILFSSTQAQANLDYKLRVDQGILNFQESLQLNLDNHEIAPITAKLFANYEGQNYIGDLRDIGTKVEIGKKLGEGQPCVISFLSKSSEKPHRKNREEIYESVGAYKIYHQYYAEAYLKLYKQGIGNVFAAVQNANSTEKRPISNSDNPQAYVDEEMKNIYLYIPTSPNEVFVGELKNTTNGKESFYDYSATRLFPRNGHIVAEAEKGVFVGKNIKTGKKGYFLPEEKREAKSEAEPKLPKKDTEIYVEVPISVYGTVGKISITGDDKTKAIESYQLYYHRELGTITLIVSDFSKHAFEIWQGSATLTPEVKGLHLLVGSVRYDPYLTEKGTLKKECKTDDSKKCEYIGTLIENKSSYLKGRAGYIMLPPFMKHQPK